MDNIKTYQTHEFDAYAFASGLSVDEEFLVSKYFDKDKKTLEVGTAGGRLVFGLLEKGFSDLYGCDLVPEFIEQAKKRDKRNEINFSVEDAAALTYKDAEFSQLIYIEQILSAVGEVTNSIKAINEAYRILEKDGVVLFTFLNFEERQKNPLYSIMIKYISFLRRFKKSPFSLQHLPAFKLGGKINYRVLWDSKPYNYWFTPNEAYNYLLDAGFDVIGIASQEQTMKSRVCLKFGNFEKEKHSGILFFICKK